MMRVTIDLEEELVAPLLKQHLETGISVKKQIANAISFHLKCKESVESGCVIYNGTIQSNGYFAKGQCLMNKETT